MKHLILYLLIVLGLMSCTAQKKIGGVYIGYEFKNTKNSSYVNQQLKFLEDNKDTLTINFRLPYKSINHEINNPGIFYNCHLQKDTSYVFILKKICVNDIPVSFHSYYKTNIISNRDDCSKFIEVERHTDYNYIGEYGKYVDIEGILYEIIGLTPSNNCFFQH